MRTRDRVSIGWADPGHVDGEFAVNIALLSTARSSVLGPLIRVEGSALISRIRNEIVQTFLDKTDSAWLLMIDSDEVLTVQAFDKLIATAHDKTHPIVAGLYFGAFSQEDSAYPVPVPLIYRAKEHGYLPVDDYPQDKVISIDAAGTGCLLIHRSVLEAIRATATVDQGPNWCWFQDEPIGGHWVGEDLMFCRKAIAAGFPIHAHTGAVLPHRKRFWLTDRHHSIDRRARAAAQN